MTVNSAIALGSNLGNSLAILQGAIAELDDHPDVSVIRCSSIYQTAPVGPPQPDYFNACALLATTLPPEALLQLLFAIEAKFGRVRRERWGARLLDLDLLLVENQQRQTPHLELPHPRMWERAFVMVPLAEIAPDWRHPQTGQTVAEICATLPAADIHRLPDVRVCVQTPSRGL